VVYRGSGRELTMAPKKNHRWQIVLIRKKGQVLGRVAAPDQEAAIKVVIKEFEITDWELQKRLVAQRVG